MSGYIKVIVNYLQSDLIKKQRSFKIGLLSIFLVVFFVGLLMNAINLFPLIFLRLSEDQAGEADIIMIPFLKKKDISKIPSSFDRLIYNQSQTNDMFENFQFLNFEELHQQLKNENYLRGVVPRWILTANISSTQEAWAMSNVIILNSQLENKYGLGRGLKLSPLEDYQCYISEPLFKSLQLENDNDTISMKIQLSTLLNIFGNLDTFIAQVDDHMSQYIPSMKNISTVLVSLIDNYLDFTLNLTINAIVPSTSGKWPSGLGNIIAIDSEHTKGYIRINAIRILKEIIHPTYNTTFIDDVIEGFVSNILKDFSLERYALTVNGLFEDKFTIYKGSQSNQRRTVSHLTGSILDKLGYDSPMTMQLPLYEAFKGFEIGLVFLENILTSVMLFLWVLSIMLIYSLMLGNVEERTYEFGMLRSLGYLKSSLITMIIVQAFVFSIPAVILAIVSCYVVNIILAFYLFGYSGLSAPFYLSTTTIFWSSAIGISIPLLSSYIPVKKALSANIKDALVIFNKNMGDLLVSIVKLESIGISPSSLLSSIILIIIGFATYYIAPLSYFLMDYSIFVSIMTIILMTMLFGLIVMIQLLIPKIQMLVLKLIIFLTWKDKNIYFVIKKNIGGHSSRNSKISIMFTIALSFIIFAGCTINLVITFIESLSKNFFGGDIWLKQNGNNSHQQTLNQNILIDYLERKRKQFPGLIKNYTFLSYPLDEILERWVEFAALSGYPSKGINLVGVDENFVSSGYSELYMYSKINNNLNFSVNEEINQVDIISGLFLNNNTENILRNESQGIEYPFPENPDGYSANIQFRMIIPEGLHRGFSVDLDNPAAIHIHVDKIQKIPCKIVALAVKLPGIPFISSYSTIASQSPVLISIIQMKEIIQREMKLYKNIHDRLITTPAFSQTPDGIRKKYFFLKFNDGATRKLKEMVYYEIQNLVNSEDTLTILIDDIIQPAKKASVIMEIFFIVIGIIALVLSFFLIWTSFYCNIKDNIFEFGILRAIGINKSQSTRIYIYEAVTILITSIIIGTIIGVVISSTLILQFNLFTELPFQSNFPYKLYSIMVCLGFLLGLLGSYYPTHEVNNLSLVRIMKGITE